MITVEKDQIYNGTLHIIEAYGLSTDTKPTSGVATGSSFVEVDTGKVYLYNSDGSAWVEIGG